MSYRTCLLLLLSLSIATAAWSQPTPLGRPRPAVIEGWQASLKEASASLKAGQWAKAKRIANRLVEEMTHRIQSGEGVEALVARPVVLRALAEAGLGNQEAAAWDWHVAQAVDPDVTKLDLTPYGAAGAALRAIRPVMDEKSLESSGQFTDCTAPDQPCERVTRPKATFAPPPSFPGALAIACIPGNVVLGAVLDEKGRLSQPRLIESPQIAVLSLSALEAVRGWKFKPATLDGTPVKVFYSLTVNYSVPVCSNPFAKAQQDKEKKKADRPDDAQPPG